MTTKWWRIGSAVMMCCGLAATTGCACKRGVRTTFAAETTSMRLASDELEAEAGECFAMVFTPPQFQTVTEQVCIKEASERLEVIPAEYEWVEERVVVKDATTNIEVVPVQYRTEERTVEVEPGHAGWVKHEDADCDDQSGRPVANDVYCFEKNPPKLKTVSFQTVAQEAECREVTVPAEYQTVRRQKLVRPATTRRVTIPAEFETVHKRVQVTDGKMDWQRVICEGGLSSEKVTAIEKALLAAGYDPGAPDGDLGQSDWTALKSFQEDQGIGVGALTLVTLDKLGVTVD